MAYSRTNIITKSLLIIFIVQISLMIIMATLFYIGVRYQNEVRLGSFWFAIILGSLGATIGHMKKIKEGKLLFYDESNYYILASTFMTILYGTVMAGVTYLLFMSHILSGDGGNGLFTSNLFPNFSEIDATGNNLLLQFLEIHPMGIKEAGKLLVWCFIAGYSEKFITGILSNMETKGMADESTEKKK